MTKAFCCYVFYRLDSDQPFYVGCGSARRLSSPKRNNAGVLAEVARHEAAERKVVRTAEWFDTREEAAARELELIQKWGRVVDGGLLENLRIGDRGGVQGRKISDDQVRKMQDARPPHTEEFKAALRVRMSGNTFGKGYVMTPAQRKLRSEQTRLGIARKRAERIANV